MKHTGLTANDEGDKLFECTFASCTRRFKTKFSMCRHALVHSQEKNFSCEYCGKKFALLQYLKEHANTHTGEKPYVCGVAGCQERFSQTGKLSLHRRTHPEYALKEYRSNASYNKKHADTTVLSLDSPESEPKKATPMIDSPAEAPKAIDSGKSALTAVKRVLLRQDSGQTTGSANSGEEWLKQPFMPFIPANEAAGLQTTLTKEALEEHNVTLPSVPDIDPLIRYLSCLQMPFSSVLRPVLPLPEKFKLQRPQVPLAHTALNLFELISRCSN